MFVLDADPQFTHTVKVKVPDDGGYRDESFQATFRVIPAEEAATFDLTSGAASADFLRRAIVHMDGLVTVDREPVSYNDAVRDQVLGLPYARAALGRTYFEAIQGARAGN
jgi:hypothetical protein